MGKSHNDVPRYSAVLEFLKLRVQGCDDAVRELDHKHRTPTAEKKCYPQTQSSYTVNVDDRCVVCKLARHSLYACKKFMSLPHEQMLAILKKAEWVLPELLQARPPFEAMPFRSQVSKVSNRDAKPQRQVNASPSLSENTTDIMLHTSQSSDHHRRVLLMTCQVQVIASDGFTTIARALLGSASSTSFVMECL